jgi:hypothetical protein
VTANLGAAAPQSRLIKQMHGNARATLADTSCPAGQLDLMGGVWRGCLLQDGAYHDMAASRHPKDLSVADVAKSHVRRTVCKSSVEYCASKLVMSVASTFHCSKPGSLNRYGPCKLTSEAM